MRLRNISNDVSINNMKKTGLKGYVHAFSVDYDIINTNDILYIHKYLMKVTNKNKIYCLNLLKNKFRVYLEIIFAFIKEMFILLLSVCTKGSFGEPLIQKDL